MALTKRAFLRMLAWLGISAPLLSLLGCEQLSDVQDSNSPDAAGKIASYKLSSHKRSSCKACKSHARNMVFKTSKAADSHRPHPGCNCSIKLVRIPEEEARMYFAKEPFHDRRNGIG